MVITLGVAICVLMHAYITGAIGGLYRTTAKFNTGHVKIQTRAMVQENLQGAADLALINNGQLIKNLERIAPDMTFHERIYFGALLDFPDETGETKFQSTSMITAVDLTTERNEIETLNLAKSLIDGRLPTAKNEVLIAQIFKENIGLKLGDSITLIGGDINGGMAVDNYVVVGTIRFGIIALDRTSIIMDITGAQEFLALEGGATDIFGFYKNGLYQYHQPKDLVTQFNQSYSDPKDEFSPFMRMVEEQNGLEDIMSVYSNMMTYIFVVFIFIMGTVLWNTGLMSGLRRYSEMGIRLAMGETKPHVYATLIVESIFVGIIGTILGTGLGLIPAYFLQEIGFDITEMMTGQMALVFEDRIRAQITNTTYISGIIPGILAPLFGALVSGLGIFRRDTSRLFVELEL